MTDAGQPILRLFREAVAARKERVRVERAFARIFDRLTPSEADAEAHSDLARDLLAARALEADAVSRFADRLTALKATIFVDMERRRGGYVDPDGHLITGFALVAEEGP